MQNTNLSTVPLSPLAIILFPPKSHHSNLSTTPLSRKKMRKMGAKLPSEMTQLMLIMIFLEMSSSSPAAKSSTILLGSVNLGCTVICESTWQG